MKTKISRQIQFNKFDAIHLDKVIELLTDIDTIMLEDAVESDEIYACTQVEMVDSDTAEIVAIRSEIENVAMMLSNLYVYVSESVGKTVSVECNNVGKFSWDGFDSDSEPIVI